MQSVIILGGGFSINKKQKMSNCKIDKNKQNKIVAVRDQSGNKSVLFQQIFNVPSISLRDAIGMYSNIYSGKLKDKVQFQIIGEKGAQNLDQIEEATFRMDNLKVAKEMEKSLGLTDNDWQTKGVKENEKKKIKEIKNFLLLARDEAHRFANFARKRNKKI